MSLKEGAKYMRRRLSRFIELVDKGIIPHIPSGSSRYVLAEDIRARLRIETEMAKERRQKGAQRRAEAIAISSLPNHLQAILKRASSRP